MDFQLIIVHLKNFRTYFIKQKILPLKLSSRIEHFLSLLKILFIGVKLTFLESILRFLM